MSRRNRERRELRRQLANLRGWRCSKCGHPMHGTVGLKNTADACEKLHCHLDQILQVCGRCKEPHKLTPDMTIRPLTTAEKFTVETHAGDQFDAIRAGALDHLLKRHIRVDVVDEMKTATEGTGE